MAVRWQCPLSRTATFSLRFCFWKCDTLSRQRRPHCQSLCCESISPNPRHSDHESDQIMPSRLVMFKTAWRGGSSSGKWRAIHHGCSACLPPLQAGRRARHHGWAARRGCHAGCDGGPGVVAGWAHVKRVSAAEPPPHTPFRVFADPRDNLSHSNTNTQKKNRLSASRIKTMLFIQWESPTPCSEFRVPRLLSAFCLPTPSIPHKWIA